MGSISELEIGIHKICWEMLLESPCVEGEKESNLGRGEKWDEM